MATILQQLDLFDVPIDESALVPKKKKVLLNNAIEDTETGDFYGKPSNQPELFDNLLFEPEPIALTEIDATPIISMEDSPVKLNEATTDISAVTTIAANETLSEPFIYANDQIIVKVKPKKTVSTKKETPVIDLPKIEQKRGRKSFKEIDATVDLINVPEDEILNQKLYYTISEVAGWFNVNTSLIRYWENEFDILQPRKTRKGDRLFRVEDIKNLQLIYFLLRQRKFSIEGAKIYLKNNRKNLTIETQLIKSLSSFKLFLKELKETL